MSGFWVYMSMESDGQVSRGYEAQVSASMVLESRAKKQRVTINPEGSQDLGWPQNHHENSSILEPAPKATKAMKIGPKATQNHEKSTLKS